MSGHPFPLALLLLAIGGPVCLSCPRCAHGAEHRIVCPPRLDPGAVQGKAPPGWQFGMPHAAQLGAAGMLHGPPDESGYLVPADSKETRQGDRTRWTQRWRFDRPHWYPTFAYCGYGGASGPLQLFHSIPEDATECTATTIRNGAVLDTAIFVCK